MIWPFSRRRPLPIEAGLWDPLVRDLPFLSGFTDLQSQAMRERMADFLTRKTLTGVHGLEVTDAMRLAVAAQACLPVRSLGLAAYEDFVEIVIHPSAFAVRRQVVDESGVTHEFDDILSGESMDGGPIVLAWDEVESADLLRTNVVIHEFVHKLDLSDGQPDGCPPMKPTRRRIWLETLHASHEAFCKTLDAIEKRLPPGFDPEDEAIERLYEDLPLDPYAATDTAEFFAVSAEAFFVDPFVFRDAFPELYAQYRQYFADDPAQRLLSSYGPAGVGESRHTLGPDTLP